MCSVFTSRQPLFLPFFSQRMVQHKCFPWSATDHVQLAPRDGVPGRATPDLRGKAILFHNIWERTKLRGHSHTWQVNPLKRFLIKAGSAFKYLRFHRHYSVVYTPQVLSPKESVQFNRCLTVGRRLICVSMMKVLSDSMGLFQNNGWCSD